MHEIKIFIWMQNLSLKNQRLTRIFKIKLHYLAIKISMNEVFKDKKSITATEAKRISWFYE